MIRATDFRLLSVQAAVFTPQQDDEFRPAKIIPRLAPLLQDRYDGEMNLASPPKQLEFAFKGLRIEHGIQLSSEDGRFKMEIGPKRCDSFWYAQSENENPDLATVCQECLDGLRAYPISGRVQIGRLALVVRRWTPLDNAPSELAEHFCRPELVDPSRTEAPLRNSQDFELHNRKRYQSDLNGPDVNSWVRCRSNVRVHEKSAVTVEHDINTLSEEIDSRAFTESEVDEFFQWSSNESKKVISIYFS